MSGRLEQLGLSSLLVMMEMERKGGVITLARTPLQLERARAEIEDARAWGFGPDDFASSHPGGALGRRLLTHVSDVMRSGQALPTVRSGSTLVAAILEVTRKRMGMVAILDEDGQVMGIFTDGDLRRLLERGGDIRGLPVDSAMTGGPAVIGPHALAAEAVQLMEARRISQLLVVDPRRHLVGALHIHDLLAAKIV